jgi:ferric enterobactin receptor
LGFIKYLGQLRAVQLLLPSWWWLIIGLSLPVFAQQVAPITGHVHAPNGTPVEFATVTLHRAADSVVVTSSYSDAQGTFHLAAQPGLYLVSAAQVGFARSWSEPLDLPVVGLELASLILHPNTATALKEVTVVGKKALFERQADRTIVNVEGTTLAAGNTALDVLSRSPGVTVSGEGDIALRGKQGLLVLIDGKRQPLSGAELAEYLRMLPAEQVKNIELITSPPASYDAQGGAGIIAINLKKDKRQGVNGAANLSYGHGHYGRFTSGGSLNYRHQKLNAFGSYTYADRRSSLEIFSHRDFYEQGQRTGTSDEDNPSLSHRQSHSWKGGLDYNLSPRTVLGLATTGLAARGTSHGTDFLTLADATGHPTAALSPLAASRSTTPNVTGNLNLRHTYADSSNSRALTADLNYASYRTHRQQDLTALGESGIDLALLTGTQTGALDFETAQVDYVRPLPNHLELSTGAKVSRFHSSNDVLFYRVADGVNTLDTTQTNLFRYDENINAAYVSLWQTTAKTTLRLGLRGEQTNTHGVQAVGNQDFERHYFQLFPSASLSYKLSDRHEVGVALSRRIDRPAYSSLNPFRVYYNASAYSAGNPGLVPQTSTNVELSHTFLQKYGTSLTYSNTQHPIVMVVQPVSATGRLIADTEVNLDVQHHVDLTLTVPVEPRKGWTIYNSVVLYYNRYVGQQAGTALNRGRVAASISSTQSITLGHGWSTDLTARYQSPEANGFIKMLANGELTLGAQKSLWQGQGTLKLNVTDVFLTTPYRGISSYENYTERYKLRFDSRAATLAFSYRFGNAKAAPNQRRADSATDEKRRAE